MNKLLMILAASTAALSVNTVPKQETYKPNISYVQNLESNVKTNTKNKSLILDVFDNFDPSKIGTYEYYGLKYVYDGTYQRFRCQAVDNPEKVDTLLITEQINGIRVTGVNSLDLSQYTNLKTLIVFDSAQYIPQTINAQLDDLYLACNLSLGGQNIKAKNVHFVATYDTSYLSPSDKIVQALLALEANHYYYYDFSKPILEPYLEAYRQANINFELNQTSNYVASNFYVAPNYSLYKTIGGITYMRRGRTSAQPGSNLEQDFRLKLASVDPRLKTFIPEKNSTIDNVPDTKFDLVDARSVMVGSVDKFKAKTLIANSNNTHLYVNEIDDLYFTYDASYGTLYEIGYVHGDLSKVGKVHIPNNNKDKFTKLIELFGEDKVEYYDYLPELYNVISDGTSSYKIKSKEFDIDVCLSNVNALKTKGVTVNESMYLDDIFEQNNMSLVEDTTPSEEPKETPAEDPVETPAKDELEFRTPEAIITSSEMDAMRFLSKTEYGLLFLNGEDVTQNATFSVAYNNHDNKSNYSFTLTCRYKDKALSKVLSVEIDERIGNIAMFVGSNQNLYFGVNCQDYNNLDDIETKINGYLKVKYGYDAKVDLPTNNSLETKTYEGTYNQGKVYLLNSGVNLKYSSPTTTVAEDKSGYAGLDRLYISNKMDIYEAVREISPYILYENGVLVDNYKVDIKVNPSSISFNYLIGDDTVLSHTSTYRLIDSDYEFVYGYTLDYHSSTLLMNTTKEDVDFNKLYADLLLRSYHYMNDLKPEYNIDLSKENSQELKDTLQRGNGSYYESEMKLNVVDKDKANLKGSNYSTIKDKDDNLITYTPKSTGEKIKETADNWMGEFKDKMENNKVFKISTITVSTILGLILIYGAFLLVRKTVRWLKRR